ncbi:AAA family ATPase [Bacteroides sp. 51]|uniref:AAA family ATPase n=1 Tax=Bacteroides sp. 51 TaxID=2302938 RepID=UPI0013D260A1|nr:AAA family ATPase [Bacteroides sp. 51]NDV80736.1 DUF2813 domain-containing protein [Bacteroides sp. 51]
MKLEKITIENFRCFQNIELSLANDVTVLIGKNGTGKSSLIHAVHNVLSFIFANNPKWGVEPLIKGIPDLKIANIGTMDIWRDKANGNTFANEVKIAGEAVYKEIPLTWNLNKTSTVGSALKTNGYKQAYIDFLRKANQTKSYPVLAYYSDSYPHINTRVGTVAKEGLETFDHFPFNWGYYQWDEESSCTYIWEQRFINCLSKIYTFEKTIEQLKARQEKEKSSTLQASIGVISDELSTYKAEVSFIEKCVQKFTDNVDLSPDDLSFKVLTMNMEIVNQRSYIKFLFADNSNSFFHELPAGYKRLLSIVFDIAYRAYILNGDKKPFGVVIIDELDLHLHPTLEQDVLQRLKNAFPEIQFIVSTHSPLVITNLKKDGGSKVVKLISDAEGYGCQELPNLYGVDYSTGVRDVMDVNSTPAEIETLKDQYFILLDKEENGKAEQVFNEIATLTGGTQSMVIREIEEERENM